MKLHSLGALPILGIGLPMILAGNVASAQSEPTTNPYDFIQNASDLMEYEVRNDKGERLGTLKDLAINMDNGLIEFVAVGAGESLRLTPPQAFQVKPDDKHLVLEIDTDRWEKAPTAARNDLDRLADESEAREIYRYYGFNHRPAVALRPGEREFGAPDRPIEETRLPVDPIAPRSQPRLLPPDLMPGDPSLRRSVPRALPRDQETLHEDLRAEREFGSPEGRGQRETDGDIRELRAQEPKQDQLVWATDLLRQSVTGADQDTVGEISDMIVDLHVGYVQHMIVSFDGAGQQSFAIPVRDITVGQDGKISVEKNLDDLVEAKEFEPRMARLRRYEPFRYDDAGTIEFAAPTRPENREADEAEPEADEDEDEADEEPSER